MSRLSELKRKRFQDSTTNGEVTNDENGDEEKRETYDNLVELKRRVAGSENTPETTQKYSNLSSLKSRISSDPQSWASSSQDLLNDIQNNGGGWYDFATYRGWNERYSVLKNQGNSLKQQYAGNPDLSLAIDEILTALDDGNKVNQSSWGIYSGYKSKEEYDAAVREYGWFQEYSAMTADERKAAVKDLTDPAELQWLVANQDYIQQQDYMAFDATASQQKIDGLNAELAALRDDFGFAIDQQKYYTKDDRYYQLLDQYGSIEGLSDAIAQVEAQIAQEKEFSEKASYYQQQAAEYQNTLNFDVEAAEEEVAQLQALLDYYETIKRPTDTPETVAFVQEYGRPDKIAQTVNEKKAIIESAKQTQEFYRLSSVSNPDSEYYDATWNQDRKTALDSMEEKKWQWLYNGMEFNYMTDKERAIFEYQLAVNGQEAAEKYLAGIKENLSYRHGKDISGDVSKFGALGEVFYMGYAGLDNWAQGVQSSFEALTGQGGKKTTTATQYAAGITRENLGDRGKLWQVGGDVMQSLGNMAPSLLLGSINPLAGYATTLVGAGGNAYQEAINMGYSDGQAKFYGVLTGASEVLLEKLLNGVGNFGGELSNHAMEKLISNIHNANLRVAAKVGGQMASEFTEEYLQEILTPVYQNIALGTDNDFELFTEEALYAGILGAISSGVFQGAEYIGNKALNRNNPPVVTTQQPESPANVTAAPQSSAESGTDLLMEFAKQTAERQEAQQAAEIPVLETATARAENPARTATAAQEAALADEDTADVIKNFRKAYDYGYRNESVADIDIPGMTDADKTAAWESGKAARDSAFTPGRTTAFVKQGTPGIVESPEAMNFAKENPAAYKRANKASKAFGIKTVMGRYGDTFNGKIQNGVMFLNLDRIEQLAKSKGKTVKRIMANVIAHEITHRMQQTNPKAYLEYRDVALKAVASAKDLEAMIDDYKATFHEAIEKQKADGKTPEMHELTDEEAMDEIVADFTAEFIENTDKFSEFVNQSEEHRSWGKKLLDFLKKVIADIKARFKTQSARDLAATNEFGFKLTDLEEAAKKWEAAWKASEKAVKKAPVQESTGGKTRYMIRYPSYSENNIQENMETLATMEPVFNVSAEKLEKTGETINEIYLKTFASWGNNIYSEEFGDVAAKNSSMRSERRHGSTAEKIASVEAIPDVINSGKVIFCEKKPHSDVERIVVCAPITIGEMRYYLGVMLQRDKQSQRLYLHDLVLEKEASSESEADLVTTGAAEADEDLFITNIIKKALDVKYKKAGNLVLDSAGRTLTPQQAEYFKDSKVRDKNGNLLVVYHGTPKGGFTIFRTENGAYFTQDKSYAELYTRNGENPEVYEGYLNITKPFDTRNAKERKIFEQEFYQKWGNGTPLSEAGLPDWTDGDDLIDFIREKGYDYDGIIISESNAGMYTEHSYAPMSSEQFKKADNKTPTKHPNVNYSVAGTESLLHKATDKELDSRYEKEVSRFNFPEATAIVEEKARRWGAILDKDGKPKHFYHGTSYGGFTEFDAYGHGKFGLFGIGNYFTENRDVAASYMEKGNGTQPEIYSVYLKADNPIDMDANADIAKWQAAAEDVDFTGCKTNEDCFVAMKEYCEDNWMVRWEAEELIMETIKGMGHDGITHIGGGRYNRNSGPRHRVVITFEPDQARSATTVTRDNDGVTIPLSERFSDKPDYRYSLAGTESLLHEGQKKAINDARNAYGTIKPGEKPAREAFVPKAMEKGKKVSMTIRTALEAGATPDAIVPKIADGIINGQFSDEVHTNKGTLGKAKAWIEAYPIAERALDDWNEKIKNGRNLDETDTVKGYLLYNLLATRASEAETTEKMEWYSEEAIKVLTSVANLTRSRARMVQSTRLLKKLTPAGQYFSLERAVERLNQQIANDTAEIQLEKGRTKLEIDQEIAAKWMQALHDGKTKEAAYYEEQLYQSIAKQVKRTFMDRWNAWRYLSMLGNAKTITRNLIGNLFMIPVKATKDKIGAIIELGVRKENRTKYLGTTHTERGNAIRAFAKEDFTNVKNLVDSDPKYSEYSRTKVLKWIQEYKSKFQWHGVKEWQQLVDWVMNGDFMGDSAFMRKHYVTSFTQIATARGWTADAIKSGKVNQAQLDIVRAMAFKEAQKATFRDINAFSGAIRKMRFKDKGFWKKTGNILLGGVLPFRQTPANVLVRAVEYSPIEIVWNLTGGLYQVASGKISATEYIDHWASALTGSVAFGFGMLLRGLGVISGGELDDDEERMGIQKYSLNIGGKSFSLDWLSPMAIPFFMGVEIQKATESNYTDPSAYISAFLSSFQPILEMSCLSGVQSLIESQSYVEGSQFEQLLVSFIWQPLVNYVAQGIPTFLSQTASATEKQGEKTYTADMESALMRDIHYPLIKALEKIPLVDWRQVPRVDAWGRVEEKKNAGDYALGALESYLSPAYINDVKVTKADKEIERLQGVFQEQIDALEIKLSKAKTWQEKKALQNQIADLKSLANISPDVASTKIGQIRLEQQEYIDYATVKGQQNYELVTALMDSNWYKGLSDERKSAAIRKIYELADAKGQYAAVGLTKDDWTQFSLDADPKTAVANCQAVLEENWKTSAIKSENAELKSAILSGTSADKAISGLKKNGKTDKDIQTYCRTEIHEMFKSGELDDKSALDRLKKYGGYSSDEANDKVTYWKFQNENPNSELSQTVALTWYRTLKGSGVALSDWEKAWKTCSAYTATDENGNTVSGLKKQRVDAYLNSLTCKGASLIKKAIYKHLDYK